MEEEIIRKLESKLYKNKVFPRVTWWQRAAVMMLLLFSLAASYLLPVFTNRSEYLAACLTVALSIVLVSCATYFMKIFSAEAVRQVYPQCHEGLGRWNDQALNDLLHAELRISLREMKLSRRAMIALSGYIEKQEARIDCWYLSAAWILPVVGTKVLDMVVDKPVPFWTTDRVITIAWCLVFLLLYVGFQNTRDTLKMLSGLKGRMEIRRLLNEVVDYEKEPAEI